MPSPTIELLLILQDRDTRRLGIEAQLKAPPGRSPRSSSGSRPRRRRSTPPRGRCASLESKKKLLETEIGSAETQRGKYQLQQLSVKKNDEYQALGHQIQDVQRQIGELEGKELEAMYAIDEAKKRFAAAEATLKQNIVGHEARIRTLRERDASLAEELKEAVGGGRRGPEAPVRGGPRGLRPGRQEAHAGRGPDPGRQVRGMPPEGLQRGRVRGARQDGGP
jgi:hypothetical protein